MVIRAARAPRNNVNGNIVVPGGRGRRSRSRRAGGRGRGDSRGRASAVNRMMGGFQRGAKLTANKNRTRLRSADKLDRAPARLATKDEADGLEFETVDKRLKKDEESKT